jgi:hypothetical protein
MAVPARPVAAATAATRAVDDVTSVLVEAGTK